MISLFALGLALLAGRIYLPIWLTGYVNKTLQNIDGYTGSVRDVDVALIRGAYTIHDLKLLKEVQGIPTPFLDFKSTDLSLQWGALFHGKIVGDVTLTSPTINFASSKNGTTQTGTDTDWTKPIKELMPLDINYVEINNGKITYNDFSQSSKVDLFIDNLNARATNIRNVEDKNSALPSNVTATGNSIGGGKLDINGRMNIIKKVPDMDFKAKLEKVDIPALNEFARSSAGIDFESGNLNIYSDLVVKDGKVSGFVKPLATNINLIDWSNPGNPIGVVWESLVSIVLEIFENQSKDQFGTQIALQGDLSNPETNFWSTLNGILKNAFVRAYSNTTDKE